MSGFARNNVFFWVTGDSVAEKSRLACATGAAILALPSIPVRFARAVELKVPGDFFSSLWMLCYCVLHALRYYVHWNCCIKAMCSTVVCCNSNVLCNSVCADRSGTATARFLAAAAACGILLRLAAETRKLYCSRCMKVANPA